MAPVVGPTRQARGSAAIPRTPHLAFGRTALIAAALLCGTASTGAGAALAATTIAAWEMNEAAGARTMRDSSASNLSGTIGSAVQTGVRVGGATGYRWSSQGKDGVRPERLVKVASSLLNPGTGGFAVTVRLRTGAGDQNIIQKGQATTAGGMWKIDMLRGRVICTFKGSQGQVAVGSSQTVWNSVWHTVRCERRASGVSITVDGGGTRTMVGATGTIANSSALAIGGKLSCNPPKVQCDYYVGLLDRVKVERL